MSYFCDFDEIEADRLRADDRIEQKRLHSRCRGCGKPIGYCDQFCPEQEPESKKREECYEH